MAESSGQSTKKLSDRSQRVIVIGDSHSVALAEAVEARAAAGESTSIDIQVQRLGVVKPNGTVIPGISEDEAVDLLNAAAPDDVFVSMIGGNQYNTMGLLEHPEPFDVLEPGEPDPDPGSGTRIIPRALMEQVFDHLLRKGRGLQMKRLREAFSGQAFHIDAPPPKADNAFVQKNAEGAFRVGQMVPPVNAPERRLRLYKLQSGGLSRLCASWNMTLINPPQSPDGFLPRDLYGRDATHANALYGEHLLVELERLFSSEKPVP